MEGWHACVIPHTGRRRSWRETGQTPGSDGNDTGCYWRTWFKRALATYRHQIPVNLPKSCATQKNPFLKDEATLLASPLKKDTQEGLADICEDMISSKPSNSFFQVWRSRLAVACKFRSREVEKENKFIDLDCGTLLKATLNSIALNFIHLCDQQC